tara:strand:+ start:2477 stop:3928 length:1452 start_codon:yes stop_codon:yes gene_type:complete
MAQPPKPSIVDQPYLFSVAKINSNAARAHEQRRKYVDSVLPLIGPQRSFNFWGKDSFFGKINSVGNATVVNEQYLKPLRHAAADETLYAINFVADAWRDLGDKVKELVEEGIMEPSGPYADISAKKAFRSITSGYHQYMTETVFPLFSNTYLGAFPSENQKILDVDSFLGVFTSFVEEYTKTTGPITVSGFVESFYCSPLNSGLVISISEDDHNDDFPKSQKYFLDANFDLISSLATQYGFGIDQNAPWRFVADLQSAVMKEYMVGVPLDDFNLNNENNLDDCDNPIIQGGFPSIDPYGFSQISGLEDVKRHAVGYNEYADLRNAQDANEIFTKFFATAHVECWRTDMDIVKVYFLDFYNALVNRQPIVSIYTPDKTGICLRARSELIRRQIITFEEFRANGSYGDKWNLKCYYLLRRTERKLKTHHRVVKKNFKDVIDVYNFIAGNTDKKYLLALKYLQEDVLGPVTTKALTIDTVGDINKY